MDSHRCVAESRWYDKWQVSLGMQLVDYRKKGIGEHTVLLRDFHCAFRLFQIRTGHHELLTTDFARTLDNIVHVIVMHLLAVVVSTENRVA